MTRRSWLVGALALPSIGEDLPDDGPALASALERAKGSGIGDAPVQRSAHYQAIGDAPRPFVAKAVALCEKLAEDYLKHFEDKGLDVKRPEKRLTLVVLADAQKFARFLGEDLGASVGGAYDLETNRLVAFDARPQGDAPGASAERINTFTLMHEAVHQLTFNAGPLRRAGDVPLAISEGLATYGESRKATGSSPLGQINRPRLEGLKAARASGAKWTPTEELLAKDALFEAEATEQGAYAQAWSLVYHLMKDAKRRPQFAKYLKAIASRADASRRVEDARKAFGPLDLLDLEVRKLATRLSAR